MNSDYTKILTRSVNPLYQRHQRSINPYTDLKSALVWRLCYIQRSDHFNPQLSAKLRDGNADQKAVQFFPFGSHMRLRSPPPAFDILEIFSPVNVAVPTVTALERFLDFSSQ